MQPCTQPHTAAQVTSSHAHTPSTPATSQSVTGSPEANAEDYSQTEDQQSDHSIHQQFNNQPAGETANLQSRGNEEISTTYNHADTPCKSSTNRSLTF